MNDRFPVTELQVTACVFEFDLCIPSYSGKSNSVPVLRKFFVRLTVITRLWSHLLHIFEDVANKIVRQVECARAVTWPISCPKRSSLPTM